MEGVSRLSLFLQVLSFLECVDGMNLLVALEFFEGKYQLSGFERVMSICEDFCDIRLSKECLGCTGWLIFGNFVCNLFCDVCVKRCGPGFCYLHSIPIGCRWKSFKLLGVFPTVRDVSVQWSRFGMENKVNILWFGGLLDIIHISPRINDCSKSLQFSAELLLDVRCVDKRQIPREVFLNPNLNLRCQRYSLKFEDLFLLRDGVSFFDFNRDIFICNCLAGAHIRRIVFRPTITSEIMIGAKPVKVPTDFDLEDNFGEGCSVQPLDSASVAQFREDRISSLIKAQIAELGLSRPNPKEADECKKDNKEDFGREDNIENELYKYGAFSELSHSVVGFENDREYTAEVTMSFAQSGVHFQSGQPVLDPPPVIGASSLVPARTTDRRLNFLIQIHAALFRLMGDEPYPPIDFMRRFKQFRGDEMESDHPSFDLLQVVLENTIDWKNLRVKRNLFLLPSFEENMHLNEMLIANCLLMLYNEYRFRWINLMKDVTIPQKVQLLGPWSNRFSSSRTSSRKHGKRRSRI